MFLSLIEYDEELYQEAKTFFLQQWRSDLLSKTKLSLIWAYKIVQYMLNHWKSDFSFINWEYNYENLYFSMSHSGNYVAIIINNKKTAIDLEFVIPRDPSLLNWITSFNDWFSNRENFYIQRCCKECIVKILNWNSEDMKDIKIKSFEEKMVDINWYQFKYLLILTYKSSTYQVHISYQNSRMLAVL